MGRPPFTTEQFFEVMRRYNEAVWPAQVGLYVLALVAIAVAWRGTTPRAGRIVSGILALLWLWIGVVYHLTFFRAINPAATLLGGLFIVQAALFAWMGVWRTNVAFRPRSDWTGLTGGLLHRLQGLARPSIALAGASFLLHLAVNNRYDVFRDELYFIVCGQHPALGYVDQPPLIPLIAGVSHALFGTALLPPRLVPALAMSATVALAVEFVRLLGGGRFAQWLCGLTVLLSPVFLANGLLLATDALQPLTWLVCSWSLVRLIQTNDERRWVGFGLAAGISLASKYLIFLYLVGLAVGTLLTPLRRSLLKPWLYLGAEGVPESVEILKIKEQHPAW